MTPWPKLFSLHIHHTDTEMTSSLASHSLSYKLLKQWGYIVGKVTRDKKCLMVGFMQRGLSSEKLQTQSPVSHSPHFFQTWPLFLALPFTTETGPLMPLQRPPFRSSLLPSNCFPTTLELSFPGGVPPANPAPVTSTCPPCI